MGGVCRRWSASDSPGGLVVADDYRVRSAGDPLRDTLSHITAALDRPLESPRLTIGLLGPHGYPVATSAVETR